MTHRRAFVAAALVSVFAAAGCATHRTAGGTINDGHGSAATNPTTVVLNPATVADLLTSITKAGLPAPNPRDVSSAECPRLGCVVKTETDTVSIMVFPTPGRAELYAGSTHDVIQLEDVVLSFSPSVPAGQRPAYAEAAKRAIE